MSRSISSSSSSDVSEFREEDGWEDAEPDQEDLQIVSLFDDKVFPDAKSMVEYCKEKFGFDFVGIQRELGMYYFVLDYYF
jgi:protein arginine N-methyltransferase 3